MNRATQEVEYEQMLLSRHGLLTHRKGRREGGLLERSAYVLLSRIRVQGPMSVGELSEAFDLDVSTLNRQTAAVMRAGYVERIPDPDGGMARKFRITEEGARTLDAEREGMVGSLQRVMSDWQDEDISAFMRLSAALQHRPGTHRRPPLAAPLSPSRATRAPGGQEKNHMNSWPSPMGYPVPSVTGLSRRPDRRWETVTRAGHDR